MPFLPWQHGDEYKYDLHWMVDKLQELLQFMQTNEAWKAAHQADYEKLYEQVQALQQNLAKLQTDIANGNFPDTALVAWAQANMERIIRSVVTYVTFGLTADGYFAAFIPPTWNFIQFDTITDPQSDLWGHLVLRW